MTVSDLAFSSPRFLALIEGIGLTGSWSCTFAGDEQVWSDGRYHLLGLEPGGIRPNYEALRGFVHHEDRPAIETAAQIMQSGVLQNSTFRIVRPDDSVRTLSSRAEVLVSPAGRPIGASGLVLDITSAR
ncbi:PAS domain-containing protein [Methylobacterium durans]|uniref:PAS domain-containing protein n=1 Tax=Methylobacterium durans TaxID=2202825 RepID=UPI0013A555D9|nr:PAS domain-containing protein [Methylobacterium durans]